MWKNHDFGGDLFFLFLRKKQKKITEIEKMPPMRHINCSETI